MNRLPYACERKLCRRLPGALCSAALMLAMQPAPAASAQDADPAIVAAGLQIYKTTPNCEVCHGWTGTGGAPHDESDIHVVDAGPKYRMQLARVISLPW